MPTTQSTPQPGDARSQRECLVCRALVEGEALAQAERLRYFADLCICAQCLRREREGGE
jgi:hypothetical protein